MNFERELISYKMKTIDELNYEYDRVWAQYKVDRYSDAVTFQLQSYLDASYLKASTTANELIPHHVFLMEKATGTLLLFYFFVNRGPCDIQKTAYLGQLARAVNCLICIRDLIFKGFEETARPVTRNYLEALDISVACFISSDFSERLSGEDSLDFDKLWPKEIAYGKIYKFLEEACKIAGHPDDSIEEHIKIRKEIKSILSASVHSDDFGAFRSMAPTPLGMPEMISTMPHGVINNHAPSHISMVIGETFKYLTLIINCMMSKDFKNFHRLDFDGPLHQSFISSFAAFQELISEIDLPETIETPSRG